MCIPGKMCVPGEGVHSQWGCAFWVSHIPTPDEDVHSQWGTSPFPVRLCITGESHPPFPVRHILITDDDVYFFVIHPCHKCVSSTGNGYVAHRYCTSSLRMGMCLTGNAHPYREWRCDSLRMHILTGNVHHHQQCISLLGFASPHWKCR